MAVRTTFVQDGAYNSPDLRFAQGMLVPRNNLGFVMPGLIDVGQPAALVTAGGGLNVRVGIFMAVAPDSGSGAYVGGNDAQVTIPVLTPETANNRVDLLCWRPLEGLATTSTGASTMGSVTLAGAGAATSKQIVHGEIYFVKGAPSASGSPAVPTTPSGSVSLARVYVAGGATTISAANITQAYTYLASAQPDVAADVPSLRGVGTGRWQAAAGNHEHTAVGVRVAQTQAWAVNPNTLFDVGNWAASGSPADPYGFFSSASTFKPIIVPPSRGGLYLIEVSLGFIASTAGRGFFELRASNAYAGRCVITGDDTGSSVFMRRLNPGDSLGIQAFSAGAPVQTVPEKTWIEARRIAP